MPGTIGIRYIIDEEGFEFIYPAIDAGVSGGIEYYSFFNAISLRQCGLVANELKRTAWLTKYDPDSPEFEKYLESIWPYYFIPEGEPRPQEWEDEPCVLKNKKACLLKYRRNFLSFLNFVIDWLDPGDSPSCGVNICGL